MYLTASKRFEFSASRRLAVGGWSDDRNAAVFGPGNAGRFGTGRNYTAYFVFHGKVAPDTGMLINISEIKSHVGDVLAQRYDHKFLNADAPPFDKVVPTPERVAVQMLDDIQPAFAAYTAAPVVCHVDESDKRGATVYDDGRVESDYTIAFSAARQTMSPHLSDEENKQLFGDANSPAGHGHNYVLRVTLSGELDNTSGLLCDQSEVNKALQDLTKELDHRHLNAEVAGLKDQPITTESLAKYSFDRLSAHLPVARVRLNELPDFFAEYHADGRYYLGMERVFDAAHRLHSPHLNEAANRDVYGKCNNPRGHGHSYRLEVTLGGDYDDKSGTLYDFVDLMRGIDDVTEPWRDKHLDLETDDFGDMPSTSENMTLKLWPCLMERFGGRPVRLRLWETPNNRFTLRLLTEEQS
jgi:6-pyruvoyltetrahydropterin/6-carboxytetrahydropterin synthase